MCVGVKEYTSGGVGVGGPNGGGRFILFIISRTFSRVCISVIQSHNYRTNEFYHRIHTHIPVHRALEHKL